jgi:hypothetical protein
LFVHWLRRAASRAACTAGSNRAIKMPMIAITTNNSTSVNPRRLGVHAQHEDCISALTHNILPS